MRRRAHCNCAGWLGLVIASLGAATVANAEEPRLNQLQVIGSHNSYHIAPAPAIQDMLVSRNPQRAQGLDYTHRPSGRAILRAGNQAGRARRLRRSQRRALRRARGAGDGAHRSAKIPAKTLTREEPCSSLASRSCTCPTSTSGRPPRLSSTRLKQIRAWSQANRRHVPILILVELKGDALPGTAHPPGSVREGRARFGGRRDSFRLPEERDSDS